MIKSLCETCQWMREVQTTTSRFLLCQLSITKPDYPKYPRQPIMHCDEYRRIDDKDEGTSEFSVGRVS